MRIRSVGVIGAGQMGNGIAHVCAVAGYDVRLFDQAPEKIEAALSTIRKNLSRSVKSGRIRPEQESEALRRIRATEQQIGLSRPQRASNVQGAFKVAPERSADIAGRRVILIDDVLTSGATVDACARALLRAKAAQVDVLVFARVVDTHRAPI